MHAASHRRSHKNSRRPWRRGRSSSHRTPKPLRGTWRAWPRAAWVLEAPIRTAASRSRASQGAGAADRGARCAEGRSIGADRDGCQCLPQLRRQAHDPQALILRSMPPRSARGGAARGDPSFPRRGVQRRSQPCAQRATIRRPRREAQRRRAATASKQRKAVAAWRDDGSLDGVDFRRDILPKLQSLPVRVIAEAMGASISHGSKVRSGLLVPHKRHWKTLARLH